MREWDSGRVSPDPWRYHVVKGTASRLVWGVVLVVVLSSCQEAERADPAPRDASIARSAAVPCQGAVTDISAAPGYDPWDVAADPEMHIIGGVAALRTGVGSDLVHQVATRWSYREDGTIEYPADPTLRLGTKMPLFVRSGAAFELRVAEDFRDRVAIGFGSSGPSLALAVGPCDSEREWLLFTGGVWLPEPECIGLEVVLPNGTTEQIRMGIGARCPA